MGRAETECMQYQENIAPTDLLGHTGQYLLDAYPPNNCNPEDQTQCVAIATWRFQPIWIEQSETNCVPATPACFLANRIYYVVVVATWSHPTLIEQLQNMTNDNANTIYSHMRFWQFAFGSEPCSSSDPLPTQLDHKFTRLAPEWRPNQNVYDAFTYYNRGSTAGQIVPMVNFELGVVSVGSGHDFFLVPEEWIADSQNNALYYDVYRVPQTPNASMDGQYSTWFNGSTLLSKVSPPGMCEGCLVHDPVYEIPKISSNFSGDGFSGYDFAIDQQAFITEYQPVIGIRNCTVDPAVCGPGDDAPVNVGIEELVRRDLAQHTSSHELTSKIVHIYQNPEALLNHSQWSVSSTLVYSNTPEIPVDPRLIQNDVYHITYDSLSHWSVQRIINTAGYEFSTMADLASTNVTCQWSPAQTECGYDGPCQAACNITYFSNITTHGWNYGAPCTNMSATVHGFSILDPHPCVAPDIIEMQDSIPDLFQPKRWLTIALVCVMIPMLVVNLAVHASRTRLSASYNVDKKNQ